MYTCIKCTSIYLILDGIFVNKDMKYLIFILI